MLRYFTLLALLVLSSSGVTAFADDTTCEPPNKPVLDSNPFEKIGSKTLEDLKPEDILLGHLESKKDMAHLLLGKDFRFKDTSKISICGAEVSGLDSEYALQDKNALQASARETSHRCTDEDAKKITAPLAPGNCMVAITILEKPEIRGADLDPTYAHTLGMRLKSPIAETKLSHLDDWPVITLCNRTEREQPIQLFGWIYNAKGESNLKAKTLIARTDFPMPKEIKGKELIVGYNKIRDILVRRVLPGGIERDTDYMRTDRGLEEMKKTVYPSEMINVDAMKGKKVLDAGCGEGGFVLDLRAKGIEAVGLDIKLSEKQKKAGFFVEADMRKLPYADKSQDIIYSTYTIFAGIYEGKDATLIEDALREFKRVLKKSGLIRLAGLNLDVLERSIKKIGGLEITISSKDIDETYMEIKKVGD